MKFAILILNVVRPNTIMTVNNMYIMTEPRCNILLFFFKYTVLICF